MSDFIDLLHKTIGEQRTTSVVNYTPFNQFDCIPAALDTMVLPKPFFSTFSWEGINKLFNDDHAPVMQFAKLKTSLNQLKEDIGEVLFNRLSDDDKYFMIGTAGVIDFGDAIDLKRVAGNIKEYDYK